MCMIHTVPWATQALIGIMMFEQGGCAFAPIGGFDGEHHHVRGGSEPD
jgi:hypothetical protein